MARSSRKIQSLNTAVNEAIPAMKEVARENPFAKILVRAIKFSNGAHWHVAQPTPLEDFKWHPLVGGGRHDMGRALSLVAQELTVPKLGRIAIPPVLLLLSDNSPTDDFDARLRELLAQPWGRNAVRIAIAIGQDAAEGPLREFIGNNEFPVLQANNPQQITRMIKWAELDISGEKNAVSQIERPRASVE